MMRAAIVSIVVLTLAGFGYAAVTAPVPAETADAGVSAPVPAWAVEATGTNVDLVERGKDVVTAAKALRRKEEGAKTALLIAALIAAICNLLLSGIKRWLRLSQRGKKWLPKIALALGVVVGGASSYALGVGALTAIIYGAGPPLAVFLQELLGPDKILGKKEVT